jgi:hypothetical protein
MPSDCRTYISRSWKGSHGATPLARHEAERSGRSPSHCRILRFTILQRGTIPSRLYHVAYVDLIVDGEYVYAHECLGDEMTAAIVSSMQD